ncbi:UNKNOWN [Stylonychia lemnae]|uniref:Uncharacterized protein n=1 Tax=Stylonychia lemnae TaxID=5949 RepID=A0A078A9S3_STYLE|nr:UNKNOWN [Stylonychia lemnae]|eukprot:CDW78929.1 UNKNOWN [Stylonychia lemnae]
MEASQRTHTPKMAHNQQIWQPQSTLDCIQAYQRFNYDNGKHYRVESDKGQQVRIESPQKLYYTPQSDKLEGYSQCPRPVALPYENVIDYNLRLQTSQYKRIQKDSLNVIGSFQDSRNQNIKNRVPTQQLMSHLSGTKTAFKINIENYRDKLINSVSKHIPSDTPEKKYNVEIEELLSESKPLTQNTGKRIKKGQEQIEQLRKKLMSNQSGKSIHGRVLSSPPEQPKFHGSNSGSPLRGQSALDQTQISNFRATSATYQFRPATTNTGFKSIANKSINISSIASPKQTNFSMNNTNAKQDLINQSMAEQSSYKYDPNQSLISNFWHKKARTVDGFETLKERYQGTLIKSFLEQARQRQNLNADEQGKSVNQDFDKFRNKWVDTDESQSFTLYNQTKTGRELLQQVKQQEIDQSISLPKKVQEYRAKTKGRFGGTQINDPAINFNKDKKWLLKANPVAKAAEDKYIRRDRFLLEKRRFQRILKEIQCEEVAGIKGVTKMPEQFVMKTKPPQ